MKSKFIPQFFMLLVLFENIVVYGIETVKYHEDENLSLTWTKRARQTLSDQLMHAMTPIANKAKSAILAVGAGMSVDTLTAARFLQSKEIQQETPLYFESFPVVGMAKTYCVDSQVGEEACTASAYLSGVKSKANIVGAPPSGNTLVCGIPDELDELRLGSIAEWAIAAGKSVGIVTTSSVTHPGVAGSYGRSSKAIWQNDNDVITDGYDPFECPDLALQLMQSEPGSKFKVILGGGRQHFLPNTTLGGKRVNSANLIEDWTNEKVNMKQNYEYVDKKDDLLNVDPSVEYLLGLFSLDHMQYRMLAHKEQPTIEDMTEVAIKVLSKNENGFFLFIFAGKIGEAHNENKGILAMDETLELSKAVKKASMITNKEDTLFVVTANHAHTMKFAGYGSRWQGYFEGIDSKDRVDDLRYLSINYANGPGFRTHVNGKRPNLEAEKECKEKNPSFKFLAQFPLDVGTSGGDDVAIFARGPAQFLFHGVMEQHMLPHLMAYSLCIGQGVTACENVPLEPIIEHPTSSSSKASIKNKSLLLLPSVLFLTKLLRIRF